MQTTPDAFGSTYDAEAAHPIEHHVGRLATSAVFGAYADGRIVGILGCHRYDAARERHKAFLWGFFVEPAFRRSGVALDLLTACVDALPSGVEQVLLTVVATNGPAIALYEKFGFRVYGTEPRSLKTSAIYSDEMLMVFFVADRGSL